MKLFFYLCFLFNLTTIATAATSVMRLEPQKGKIEFKATGYPSALHIDGLGEGPSGELTAEKQTDGSLLVSGSVTLAMESLNSGIGLRDKHMKEKYLETEKYKTAILKIDKLKVPESSISAEKPSSMAFQGELTLHGTTHEIKGTASLQGTKDKLRLNSNFTIQLSDYAIAIPKFAGVTVAEEVKIDVSSEISSSPSAGEAAL